MSEPNSDSFAEFLRRIRAGDELAAAELVRRYEGIIRREVRIRLTDPSLRRVLDSMDVCQSVLASFFVRVTAGQYDLEAPTQLLRLLVSMARNKVAEQARRQRAQRRDGRRLEGMGVIDPVDGEMNPSRVVAGRELLEKVYELLSAEERVLTERRARGREWAEIAAELGGSPDGRRMQLARALDRVARELGLDEGDME